MLTRLLLDPETTAEGGNIATTTETKVVETPVVPKPDPTKITIDKAEHESITARLKKFEADEHEKNEKVRLANEAKLKEQNKHDEIIKERDATITTKNEAIATERRARESLEVIAGQALAKASLLRELPSGIVEGTAEQLVTLMLPGLESKLVDGEFVVTAKDGRTVSDYVKGEIGKKYQHFITATNRGGAGAAANKTTQTNDTSGRFKSEGHRMVAAALEANPNGGGVPGSERYKFN